MRERLRSSLTYANVMATLAVFLVLGGGTALGAYVVSSNSQIGPNTVSGHKPPAGKHANIIAASINGQDVAADSLTGAKINESTLGTVPNADQLDGIDSSGFLGVNAKAADADQLDGIDSSGFLGASAKAADADLLDGKNSTDFVSHHLVVETGDTSLSTGFAGNNTVSCSNGGIALGGGVQLVDSGVPTFSAGSPVLFSRPHPVVIGGVPEPRGWEAAMFNNTGSTKTMRIWVICAP